MLCHAKKKIKGKKNRLLGAHLQVFPPAAAPLPQTCGPAQFVPDHDVPRECG